MTCVVELRVVAEARGNRADCYLREVIAREHALCELEYFQRSNYDWAAIRHAEAEARLWEARCDKAEVALAVCRKKLKTLLQ